MPQNRFWILFSKKLSGEASNEELQELEDLLQKNPDWYYSMQHIQDIWNLSIGHDHYGPEEAFQHHLQRIRKKGSDTSNIPVEYEDELAENPTTSKAKKRKRWLLLSTPLVLAIICIVVISYKKRIGKDTANNQKATSEVSTRKGSKSKMVLPDGSVVWLNAGSTLTYNKNFGNVFREVTLVGEVYFDVVKLPEMPLVIHTNEVYIKVLGTTFNVKCYPGEKTTETSLLRGSVEITLKKRPTEKFILKPNEKLVVANEDVLLQVKDSEAPEKKIPLIALEKLTYYPTDSSIIETSWIENKLVFSNESFRELSDKLERWYNVVIEIKDAKLKEERMTGRFTNETIQQALDALQYSTNFQYTIHQNTIIITK